MLIHEISHVDERAPNSGRWVAAARANRRKASAPAQEPVVPSVTADYESAVDEISDWASRQGMTLASVQAAYEAI